MGLLDGLWRLVERALAINEQIVRLTEQVASLTENLNRLLGSVEKLRDENKTFLARIVSVETRMKEKEAKLRELADDNARLTAQYERLDERVANLNSLMK